MGLAYIERREIIMRELIVYHTEEQLAKVKELYERLYGAIVCKSPLNRFFEIKSTTDFVIAKAIKDSSITEAYRGERFTNIYFMENAKVTKYIYYNILEPTLIPVFLTDGTEMCNYTRTGIRIENILK